LKSGCLSFTFSCLQSHHCEGSEKNCRQSFSAGYATVSPTFPPRVVANVLLPEVTICPFCCESRESRWHIAIATRKDLEVASKPRRGVTSIATSNERQDTGSKHKLATIRSNNREFNLRTRLESVILHYVQRKNGEGQEERKGEREGTQEAEEHRKCLPPSASFLELLLSLDQWSSG